MMDNQHSQTSEFLFELSIRDYQQKWEKSQKFNTDELIDIFGKEEVTDLCIEKIRGLFPEYNFHKRLFEEKLKYLNARRFNEIQEHIIKMAIELGHRDSAIDLIKQLRYLSTLYLKVQNKALKFNNSLTNEVIERAREYPTHELYEGKKIKSGRRFFALCPFHKERTPSFFFYENGSYHCFGCQVHGFNAIDYIMKLRNLSFKEAVLNLK